jgi:hypothetical protein
MQTNHTNSTALTRFETRKPDNKESKMNTAHQNRSTFRRMNPMSRWLSGMLMLAAAATPAMADLVVRVNNEEVQSHEEVNFAPTKVGGFQQIIVTLRNESSEDIFFTEDPPIMMSGGFPESFELVQPALEQGGKLSPNGSTAFAIQFVPQVRYANLFTHLYIYNTSSSTPFHLIARGQGTAGKMVVYQAGVEIPDLGSVEFPETVIGETSELTFEIHNEGDADLELTEVPPVFLGGGFDFDFEVTEQPESTIAPGAFSTVTVAFAPTLERFYSTRMFIYNDDPELQDLYDIDLLANAVAPADDNGNNTGDNGGNGDVGDDTGSNDDNTGGNDDVGNDTGDDGIDDGGAGDDMTGGNDGHDDQTGGHDDGTGIDDGSTDNGFDNNDDLNDDPTGQDQELEDDELEEVVLDSVGGVCGFGAPMMLSMCMVSLAGVKIGRRRRC